MSSDPQQIDHRGIVSWWPAAIAAFVAMVVTAAFLYLPLGNWTVIVAVGLLVFVGVLLWIRSHNFAIWCQRMAGSALGAVVAVNVPTITLSAKWRDATADAHLEGQHFAVSIALIVASFGFGLLSYFFRRPAAQRRGVSGAQNVTTKGNESPVAGRDQVSARGDAVGRDLKKTTVRADRVEHLTVTESAGALIPSETNNKIIDRLLKDLDERDTAITEKDELIQKLKEAIARAQEEAKKGGQAAQEAIDELRKSNDTEKLQRVLEAEADSLQTDFIERCLEISAVAYLRGDIATARSRVQDVLAAKPDDVRALNQLGHIERLLGNLDEAESAYRRVIEAGEGTGNETLISVGAGNLGNILKTRGDLEGAEAMHRKSLEIEEKAGRLEGMASDYGNLGLILKSRGDLDGAEAMHRKALEINEKLGRLEGVAIQYGNLGLILQTRGDLDGAEAMHRKALETDGKLGRLHGMASQCGNLGLILQTRGDLDGAETMYRKALEISEKLGMLELNANSYGNLGNILETRGDLDGAEAMYRKALQIDEKLGRVEGMAGQYGNLGNILQIRGDLDGAETMHRKALEISENLGMLELNANTYGNLGSLFEKRGNPEGAREHWQKSRDLYKQIGMPYMVETVERWLDDLPPETSS